MDIQKDFRPKLTSVIDHLKEELATIRTNRPSPKLVEHIKVNYMEQDMTIQQLASIAIQPPRQIVITAWDKGAALPIANAIEKSGLGVSAVADGNIVRVSLPSLTDERRKELEKLVRRMTEESRIALRSIRDDANKKIDADLKAKEITEDDKFKLKEYVQKGVDDHNKQIEELLEKKIAEIQE